MEWLRNTASSKISLGSWVPEESGSVWPLYGLRSWEPLRGLGPECLGQRTRHSETMSKFSSIFRAEIQELEDVLQFNLERKYRNQYIVILSDSQAALKELISYVISSKMVRKCLGKLKWLRKEQKSYPILDVRACGHRRKWGGRFIRGGSSFLNSFSIFLSILIVSVFFNFLLVIAFTIFLQLLNYKIPKKTYQCIVCFSDN